jgi:hypothetical protein
MNNLPRLPRYKTLYCRMVRYAAEMIDNYRFGQVVVDGQTYERDLLIFPERVAANWWREKGHELAVADLTDVLADPPEVLVVGTGRYGRMAILPETEQALASQGVQIIAQPTASACQTFNQVTAEGRRAVAALHLTC